MATVERQQAVYGLLERLDGLEPLKELFWTELNYERESTALSRRNWGKMANDALADDPILFASGGRNNDFHVIYAMLASERLRLTDERPVVSKLFQDHPYSLFIFSDESQKYWHFVNIRFSSEYATDIRKRRMFRRISVGPYERLRTASERIAMLDLADITTADPLSIQERHDEAFNVEAVTKQFFDEYKVLFTILQEDLSRQTEDGSWAHDYSLQILNRIMFLYFVQRKGWIGENREFLKSFWGNYNNSSHDENSFFQSWLKTLFFEAFNNRPVQGHRYFPDEIRKVLAMAPYLNGGLFRENDLDNKYSFNITDRGFQQIFEFFDSYNFTISEDSPLDQEVAVDPEMIGKVYESLVNVSEEAREKGEAGIFYTPRTEIDLMCRLSLVDLMANHLGEKNKNLLYEFVMALDPEDKEEADKAVTGSALWPELYRFLSEITVLDPACGSGSFLVGMLNILDDLLERGHKHFGKDEPPYERKKRIIGNSLYGVDVMDWACQVAELRLWLALIVDPDFNPPLEELHFRSEALLPNFTFKVRCGDSLVQEVGGINIGHVRERGEVLKALKSRITRLKNEKLKYYNNDPDCKFSTEEEAKQEELQIFRDLLDEKLHSINEKKKVLHRKLEGPERQIRLDGTLEKKTRQIELEAANWKRELETLEAEAKDLASARATLKEARETPFVWDISFVEIFGGEKQGFDIVIGNPPYVRQEKISDPMLPREMVTTENKKKYKDKLIRSVYQAYPDFFGYKATTGSASHRIDAKSDLYIYFYFHGLSLLNPKGSFCFITSNSWLDANYGKDLQEFLLKHSHVKMVIDNQRKRTFPGADVNTAIVLLSPPDEGEELSLGKTARFVMFKEPFEHILHPVIFEEIDEADNRVIKDEYRVYPVTQEALLKDGCEMPDVRATGGSPGKGRGPLIKVAKYIGNKWGGKYLRAPDIFFTLLEKVEEYKVNVGELVIGERYLNTGGANGFFILSNFSETPDGKFFIITNESKEGKEDGCPTFMIEREFAHEAIKSPNIDSLFVRRSDALVIDLPNEVSPRAKAKEYILWGEKMGFNQRSVTRLQNPWWRSPRQARLGAPLLWLRYHYEAHKAYYNPSLLISADAFYRLRPNNNQDTLPLVGILNSTYMALFKEMYGTVGYGLGVLGTRMDSMLKVTIPFPDSNTFKRDIVDKIKKLSSRPIKPLYEEKDMSDRRSLDDVVFDVLELTTGEQEAVYEAVIELIETRLKKAKSLKPKNTRKRIQPEDVIE